MNSQLAVLEKRKASVLPASRFLQHAAVRPIADHATQPGPGGALTQSHFGQDFSQVAAHSESSVVRSELTPPCPLTPTRCPFGGACHTCPVRVQSKLKVGPPDDEYEQEADRVAETVMRMPKPQQEDEEQCHTPGCSQTVQRQATGTAEPAQVPSIVHEVLHSPGQPLDPATRAFMEPRFGHDFSQVRVHTDAKAAESACAVNARAYTVGRDVVFGAGQYAHGSSGGQRLLAHELTHIVQQSGMAVNTIQRWPEAGEGTCTDNERASQSRAQSLVERGTEGRRRTFGPRLTPAENLAWARLTPECQRDPEQCPEPHSHDPRPRTPWSLSKLHGRIHAAMDVAQAPRGTPVYAPIRGRVLQSGWSGTYGNVVMVLHECPPHTRFGDGPVTTIFAHMDSRSVSLGQDVPAGDQVGTVGDTGEGGLHLHFSVQHVPRRGPPQGASSEYEERPAIRINPHEWLSELGIPVAPAGIAEGGEASELAVPAAPAETRSEQSPPAVLRRSAESPINYRAPERTRISQTHLHIQRKPLEVTALDFLGLHDVGGVNRTMRLRLDRVDRHLRARFNAIHGRAPIDDRELREWAGVTTISGWSRGTGRNPRHDTSKHCSGSAVDVNSRNQPYIVTRSMSGELGGERGRRGPTAPQRPAAAEVYNRAVRFVFGDQSADVSERRPKAGATPEETTSAVYQRFRHVSDALRVYLGFAFHSAPDTVRRRPMVNIEGATEEQLLEAIPTTERKEEATAVEDIRQYILGQAPDYSSPLSWDTDLAREYYFRMLRDYEHVRIPMERGEPVARPSNTRNPARGFLHMTEEFVVAMADVGGLRWGIADFGEAESGDTHHFDLGNHGGVRPDCSP
jgi:murein DD-endopeptidase MepM/ murein hydrolase activator NlpD